MVFDLTDEQKFNFVAEGEFNYDNEYSFIYDKQNNLFILRLVNDVPEYYSNLDDLLNRDNELQYWFEVYVVKNNKRRILFETFDIDIAEQISREEAGYIDIVVNNVERENLIYYELRQ